MRVARRGRDQRRPLLDWRPGWELVRFVRGMAVAGQWTFTFDLERDEHVRACRQLQNSSVTTYMAYAMIVGGQLYLIASALKDVAHCERIPVSFFVVVIVAVIVAVGLIALMYFRPELVVRAMRKSRRWQGPHVWRLTPEAGFEVAFPGGSTHYDWSMVERITESSDFYFLRVNSVTVHVLPKRAVGEAKLGAVFRAAVGSRAKVRD